MAKLVSIVQMDVDTSNKIVIGYRPNINNTASKTYTLSDAGTYYYCTNTTAIILTVPIDSSVSFPIGTEIENKKGGSGALSIDVQAGASLLGDSGVVLTTPFSLSKGCCLKKVLINSWVLEGS